MRKSYFCSQVYPFIKNERGVFLPIAILFFMIVFILTFQVARNLTQEVNYHSMQLDWLRSNYLMMAGTDEAIKRISSGRSDDFSGEWKYSSGTVKYKIANQAKGIYFVNLTLTSGQSSQMIEFLYDAATGKVIKWEEKLKE